MNVASGGIVSLLLPSGRILHSQFVVSLDILEESCCRIENGSKKAALWIMTGLIICDEAPIVNRWTFEAFDVTLCDVMSNVIDGYEDLSFGDKTIVFSGVF